MSNTVSRRVASMRAATRDIVRTIVLIAGVTMTVAVAGLCALIVIGGR